MHPFTRLDRRYKRLYYIRRRRLQRQWDRRYRIPKGPQDFCWDLYLRYLEWEAQSDEDKVIQEVEAELFGEDLPYRWEPTVWGKYAKWNGTHQCAHCSWYQLERYQRMKRLRILNNLETKRQLKEFYLEMEEQNMH